MNTVHELLDKHPIAGWELIEEVFGDFAVSEISKTEFAEDPADLVYLTFDLSNQMEKGSEIWSRLTVDGNLMNAIGDALSDSSLDASLLGITASFELEQNGTLRYASVSVTIHEEDGEYDRAHADIRTDFEICEELANLVLEHENEFFYSRCMYVEGHRTDN